MRRSSRAQCERVGTTWPRLRPLLRQRSHVMRRIESASTLEDWIRFRLALSSTNEAGSFLTHRKVAVATAACFPRLPVLPAEMSHSPYTVLLPSRRDNPIKAQGETRRVSRALSLPWVRGHLSAESQRDGPNPRRIVRPIPVHDGGRVHGTHPERSFVDDVVAGSGCTSRVGHEDRRCATTVAGSSWKTQCGHRSAPMIVAYSTRPV